MFLSLPPQLCWDGVQPPRDPENDLAGRKKKKMRENINADSRRPSISEASFQLVIFTIHRETCDVEQSYTSNSARCVGCLGVAFSSERSFYCSFFN